MYESLPTADIRSAFNDSREASKLYERIAAQFDSDTYLVEPEFVEVRRAYTMVTRILRNEPDWNHARMIDDEIERLARAMGPRASKRRDALQACYDDLNLVLIDVRYVYEQNHAWDD